ncbi:hypothetical protein MUO66_04520 [Candidatus Bathyarchaeota archaeon]|nr:hypothetical protein [Candidatus Bathyarchaeota archaeon]
MKRKTLTMAFIIMLLVILVTINILINLQNTVVDLQNQIVGLEEYVEDIEDLQNEINFMLTPKIMTNLGVSDVRTDPHRLYIDGFVCNCGFETAYNCGLKVTLFRNREVVEETIIDLLTVENGKYVKLSKDIHYTGDRLTHWTIIPIFD